ncbi:hypothetical protein H5Q40_12890 [Escherichia coli]|nr:hypothetical protein [Escherichia coli]
MAGENPAFFVGTPGGVGLSTGRVGAEKSTFLWFYRHHHHERNLLFLIVLMQKR